MNTSANLVKALDRYNVAKPEDQRLHLNWGREGNRGTWFFHEAFGANLRTGLAFHELRDAVRNAMRENDDYIATAN